VSRHRGRHHKEMNTRQALYATAYIETLNGKLAAVKAGYSEKSAVDISKRLQTHPLVRAAIDKGLEQRERELKDKTILVMEHTVCQATVDIGDLFDKEGSPLQMWEMPEHARLAISSVEIEYENVVSEDGNTVHRVAKAARFKLHDKRASQELFVKYAGKLVDKMDVRLADTLEALVPKRKSEGEPA